MRLNYVISRFIYFEGILFSLACEKSAVYVAVSLNNAVENHNRHSALLSLDYVPHLSNFVCRRPGK
jgi:hypothetical protein